MAFIYCPVPKHISEDLFKTPCPGKKESAEDAHITLVYFDGDLNDAEERHINTVLQSFYKVWYPGPVSTNKLTHFDTGPGEYPIVFEISGSYIHKLRNAICYCLDRCGISYSDKFPDYKPHVTLAYSDFAPLDTGIEKVEWEIECVSFGSGTSTVNKTFHSYYFSDF